MEGGEGYNAWVDGGVAQLVRALVNCSFSFFSKPSRNAGVLQDVD